MCSHLGALPCRHARHTIPAHRRQDAIGDGLMRACKVCVDLLKRQSDGLIELHQLLGRGDRFACRSMRGDIGTQRWNSAASAGASAAAASSIAKCGPGRCHGHFAKQCWSLSRRVRAPNGGPRASEGSKHVEIDSQHVSGTGRRPWPSHRSSICNKGLSLPSLLSLVTRDMSLARSPLLRAATRSVSARTPLARSFTTSKADTIPIAASAVSLSLSKTEGPREERLKWWYRTMGFKRLRSQLLSELDPGSRRAPVLPVSGRSPQGSLPRF